MTGWYDEEADAALVALEADPTRAHLWAAVSRILVQLDTNPGDATVRRRRFQNGLWCVLATGDGEEWAILWEFHPTVQGDFVVQYAGPASFS